MAEIKPMETWIECVYSAATVAVGAVIAREYPLAAASGAVALVVGQAVKRWVRHPKLAKTVWRLMVHGVATAAALQVVDLRWALDPPLHMLAGRAPWALEAFCMVQLGMAYESTLAYALWPERRQDHTIMMLHHLITPTLIYWTMQSNHWRFGAYIMLLHDSSDAVLALTKSLHYSGCEAWSQLAFAVNLLATWPYTRLYLYPMLLWTSRRAVLPHVPINAIMLILLAVMHWWWWFMMLRVALNLSSDGNAAIQSNYE